METTLEARTSCLPRTYSYIDREIIMLRIRPASGRRIESMGGNLKSTLVHFLIGGAWSIFKVKGDGLLWLYERFYGWNERGEKSKQEKKKRRK